MQRKKLPMAAALAALAIDVSINLAAAASPGAVVAPVHGVSHGPKLGSKDFIARRFCCRHHVCTRFPGAIARSPAHAHVPARYLGAAFASAVPPLPLTYCRRPSQSVYMFGFRSQNNVCGRTHYTSSPLLALSLPGNWRHMTPNHFSQAFDWTAAFSRTAVPAV